MNLPNRLTLARLVLTVFFLAAMFWPGRFNDTVALFLFSLASLTDYYDGMIARRDKLITNFGTLMDPLADKILTCSAFIAFVGRGTVPAWVAVIIVARELAITGLRLLAATKNVVLAAEGYGKHKTVSQIVAVLVLLVADSYDEWGHWGEIVFKPWASTLAQVALWVTVTLTLTSGMLYLWRNRNLYLQDM
ncbi:MAG TPA: CDP-diacylglycerol--glycerol-3-phosphate 3-phosphatidyltransferase [Candidatus Binatia bacterium]|nr:CDP-diacylglycerol--glycerol-3-phosphate 3-phosphatidyltransferase [Candidatus Binatia bacterium]